MGKRRLPRLGLPDVDRELHLKDGRLLLPRPDVQAGLADLFKAADHRYLASGAWQETVYRGLGVLAGLEETPYGVLLHVSFSYPHRLPDWNDVKAVRSTFYPDDLNVMQVLPRPELYVNVHPYTLHLWQMPFAWDIM